jgi:hypothetical protein
MLSVVARSDQDTGARQIPTEDTMNIFTRSAAVAFAAAGLSLAVAPLAGAATGAPATVAASPAHPHPGHGGHHWGHHHGYWRGDSWYDCDGEYFYNGYWYDSCGDVLAADPYN